MNKRWRNGKLILLVFISFSMLVFLGKENSAKAEVTPPPPNDNLANAIVIPSSPFSDTQNTINATDETGIPSNCVGSWKSVWYSYTPDTTDTFIIDTMGSSFQAGLVVYEDIGGGNISLVDCEYSYGGKIVLEIDATAGTTYLIEVGGKTNDAGSLWFHLSRDFTSCAVVDVPQEECEILTDFYNSTGGPDWNPLADNSPVFYWFETDQVCIWTGISCLDGEVHTGHVQELDLGWYDLNGEIIDLNGLPNLSLLDASHGRNLGDLPTIISYLPSGLEFLDIHSTETTGAVPPEISNLTNLKHLNLGENPLSWDLADLLPYLPPSLEELRLWYCDIYGTIPPEISNLTNLKSLLLSGNRLSGDLSKIIGNLPTGLEELYLDNNQFNGAITEDISNLTNLVNLYLNGNLLTGSIPEGISSLTSLTTMYLNDNQLTGSIPAGISNLTNLETLLISNNQLTGSIPEGISGLTSLKKLYLNDNQLTGSIPAGISNLTKVDTLVFSNNQLTGSIPEGISNLPNLVSLQLENNQITGGIPSGFSNLYYLESIDLSNNLLNGNLSTMISNLPTGINLLDLGNNQITGTISTDIADFWDLWYLFLNDNQLTGDLSVLISYFPTTLSLLDLQNNQFTGTISAEISNITYLSNLDISNNPDMSGIISMGITELMYLGYFNFEGTNLCEPDDPGYDVWQAGVLRYYPSLCNEGPPDLTIDGISFTPTDPQWRDTVNITVHMRNAAEDLEESFSIDLYLDRAPTGCGDSGDMVQVFDRFSGRTTLDAEFSVPDFSAGDHEIYAFIDTDCTVEESDEENNSFGPAPVYIGVPPEIQILSPLDKSAFDFNAPITLTGIATDKEDGDISSLISWNSDLEGSIGIGDTVIFSSMIPGNHVITASITDSHGNTMQWTIMIRIFENRPPVPILFNPEFPEGAVGLWHKSVAMFGDKNGSSDFLTLQVHMDAGPGNLNGLNVQYLVDTNELYLQAADSENWIGPCTPGNVGTLSNGYVEINCKLTTPYYLAEHFMKLRILARWIQPIEAPIEMNVLLRATDIYDNDSGFKSKGTWTLLPE